MTAGFVLLILILITIGVLQDSSQNKRTYKIIMVPKTIDESNDFWTGLIEGAKLGAEEFGCEIEVVGSDSEDDYEGQNRLIEESIKKNPDAFLIAPIAAMDSPPFNAMFRMELRYSSYVYPNAF